MMAGHKKSNHLQPMKELKKTPSPDISCLTLEDIQALIEEQHVQQVELELQVEELKHIQEELSQSRDRYQELYDTVPVGYLTIDKKYKILEANATATKMLGIARISLLKAKFTDFISPTKESQDLFYLHLRQLFKIGSQNECELEIQRSDGGRFFASLQTALVDNSSNPVQTRITITDITERKKLEIELNRRTIQLEKVNQQLELEIRELKQVKENEERLNTLMDHNPSLIFMKDEKGRYIYLNQAYEDTFVGSQDWHGKTDFDLWPGESAELFRKDDVEVLESGQTKQFLEDSKDLHGVRHCWITYKFPFTGRDGQIYLGGIGIDAVDRIRAEEALKESESRANALIKYAPTGIYELDLRGPRILSVNDAMCYLSGYTREEFLSMNPMEILTEKSRKLFAKRIKLLLAGEKLEEQVDYEVTRKDGSIVNVIHNISFSKDKPYIVLVIGHDITERKHAEKALASYKDELEKKVKERTEQLQEAYDKIIQSQIDLKEANKQLKQYAHKITQVQEEERKRIAYELHDDTAQYLSILKMQIGALAESEEIQNPKVKEKLHFLEKDADRAFNDVRRYSHELRPTTLEHQGLVAAVEQIADDFNNLGQLLVEVHIEGMEPQLSEEVKLGFFRIAQEALNNSRKHSKAKQVNISLCFNHKRMRMMVIDDGIGFNAKEALKKSSGKGSLGLLSMRERADLIGANLKIESEPDRGTSVRVDIPYNKDMGI